MFLSETFRVGPRTVTMTLSEQPPQGGVLPLQCEWFPDTPAHLTRGERRQYQRGRHRFMSKLAGRMKGKIMVVDL